MDAESGGACFLVRIFRFLSAVWQSLTASRLARHRAMTKISLFKGLVEIEITSDKEYEPSERE